MPLPGGTSAMCGTLSGAGSSADNKGIASATSYSWGQRLLDGGDDRSQEKCHLLQFQQCRNGIPSDLVNFVWVGDVGKFRHMRGFWYY